MDMRIISHRGYWIDREERNSMAAFKRSFSHKFGLETDLRDLNEDIVISHDMATTGAVTFDELLTLYERTGGNVTLALNIKADGLSDKVGRMLADREVDNYFFFDMSVPETLRYVKAGLRFFTRISEYEDRPSLYGEACGVWIDCFKGDWVEEKDIVTHLKADKQVCIVSPELHGRDHRQFWDRLRSMDCIDSENVMLCTDHPTEAKKVIVDAR